jgi:hypothetical protein
MLYYTFKATNKAVFQQLLDEKVSKEKSKILADLTKKKEEEKEEASEEEEYEDWVKKLIPFGSFKNLENFGKKMLKNLMDELNGVQGIVYKRTGDEERFEFVVGYGLTNDEPIAGFVSGEGLNGETVRSGEVNFINDIPENYFQIESGLGKGKVGYLVLIPIVNDGDTVGLIEFASFNPLKETGQKILKEYAHQVSNKFYQLIRA